MSSSLFDLISLAGSASLDELRARSSVDDITLANTVATMVASGRVVLSVNPDFKVDDGTKGLIRRLGEATGELKKGSLFDRNELKEVIQAALETTNVAEFITASPTSRGFRGIL